MLSRVDVNINDTSGGASSNYETGIHAKVGVSPTESTLPILIKSSMSIEAIREKLGNSPLADACLDSIENGAGQIYCMPVPEATRGTISAAAHEGEGTGIVTAQGTPTNDFTIIVKVTGSGANNEATVTISEDGGLTWLDDKTIPLSGKMTVPNTGVELVFTTEAPKKFIEGDTYTFTATAPTANNADLLKACQALLKNRTDVEFVHVVGVTTPALWASLETLAMQAEKDEGRPIFYICEQRYMTKDETLEKYVAAIKGQAKSTKSRHVCVVGQWASYVRADGRTLLVNVAGAFAGTLAGIKESTSAAYVRDNVIPEGKVLKLMPSGIGDYLEQMDKARYVMLREYPGKDGFYWANTNMTADEASVFANVEDCRVMYRIARAVYRRAVEHQNRDFDQTNAEVSLREVQEDLNVPMDDAMHDAIVSSGRVTLLFDEMNEGKDKTLPVRIAYVSRGYLRRLELDFNVVNVLA